MDYGGTPMDWGLTVEQACKILGISRSTFYERVADGTLSRVKLGRRTVVPMSSVQDVLAGPAHQQTARRCLALRVSSDPREVAFLTQMTRAETITQKQSQWLYKIAARIK